MRDLKYILTLIAMLIFGRSNAQNFTDIDPQPKKHIETPPLLVGTKAPDLAIDKLINWTSKTARISDFKDQLLILDFWGIGCSGCVEALPKMEALQKQFGRAVMILPVNVDQLPEAFVANWWKENHYTKNLSLPTVIEDKVLKTYFRHKSIPHEAWIYKGEVIAVTDGTYVDANNIAKVLRGEQVNWPEKYDFYTFDGTKERLFKLGSKQVGSKKYYAAIDGFREGLVSPGFSGAAGIVRNTKDRTIRTWFLNESIFNAYLSCWNRTTSFLSRILPTYELTPNKFIWEVSDPNKYKYDKGNGYQENWLREHAICFESVHPDTGQSDKQVYASIIADLDSLLGLKVRWEKRMEKVLVVKLSGSVEQIRTKKEVEYAEGENRNIIRNGSSYQFRDYPLKDLNRMFSQEAGQPYVFDGTGLQTKDHVDLDLDILSWTDFAAVRKALKAYGIELVEEERLVDKFVFTEVK